MKNTMSSQWSRCTRYTYLAITVFTVSFMISCSNTDPEILIPTLTDQTFSVAEDINDAVEIGTVVSANGLTYSIKINSNDLFDITNEGVLSLASNKSLDYETSTSHEIIVTISDGEAEADGKITINVTDVEEAFVTVWKTTEAAEFINIPTDNETYTYAYDVDWGDGSSSENQTGDISHQYAEAGEYEVSITGLFPAIYFGDEEDSNPMIIDIKQWGDNPWSTMVEAFYECENLNMSATDNPDLSNVTDMSRMFEDASTFDGDIGDWDVSNVTNSIICFMALKPLIKV